MSLARGLYAEVNDISNTTSVITSANGLSTAVFSSNNKIVTGIGLNIGAIAGNTNKFSIYSSDTGAILYHAGNVDVVGDLTAGSSISTTGIYACAFGSINGTSLPTAWTKQSFSSDHRSSNMTVDLGNNRITPTITGIYNISILSTGYAYSDTSNTYMEITIYKAGSIVNSAYAGIMSGSTPQSVSFTFTLPLTATSDYIEVYYRFTNVGTNPQMLLNAILNISAI